jgi:RNA polymerase sigma factor (sigma-70 family)
VRPFDELVREHGAVVMRVCRAMLSPADAEEAWSETFLAALRAYPRLRPDSNERGWLVTIAHRKALDQLRASGRRARPVADVPDTGTADPPPVDEELRAALTALAPAQREAVVLHHLGGMPYADVAAELGVSPAAARRRAADGIATMRARMGVAR